MLAYIDAHRDAYGVESVLNREQIAVARGDLREKSERFTSLLFHGLWVP